MHKYRLISKKGEGTFSEVLKAQSIKTGRFTAIKCMKNTFDSIDQVNNLREIQALRRLGGHPHVIKLMEVLYDEPTGRLALVFELMDMNMYEAIRGRRHYLPESKVQLHIYEVLKALDHMHRHGIFHRDVKPENLLLSDDDKIKLADLGSCRGIYSRQPYTEYISTRWYRAPECLLTDGYYNFKMDIFAAGCVWFEIVALFPLFPGVNELDQIQKIHNVLGTPSPELLARKFKRNASHMDFNFPEKRGTGIERLIPHASAEVTDLLKKLLEYDPDDRIIGRQALKDPYFKELRALERQPGSAPAAQQSSENAFAHLPQTVSAADYVAPREGRSAEAPRRDRGGVPGPSAGPGDRSSAASPGGSAASEDEALSPGGAELPVEEAGPVEMPASSSTLPALGVAAGREPPAAQHGIVEKDVDEDDVAEGSTLLPPIGKAGLKPQRQGKDKEKAKALKAAANATLRTSSNNFSAGEGGQGAAAAVAAHGLGGSKGFERAAQDRRNDPMGSSYGNKFKQTTGAGQASTMGQPSNFGNQGAPVQERRDPKGGQLPRQYVSSYSHKQSKR